MNLEYTQIELHVAYPNEISTLFNKYHSGKSQNKTQNIMDPYFKVIAYKHFPTGEYSFTMRGAYNHWNSGVPIENPGEEMIEKARIMFGDN